MRCPSLLCSVALLISTVNAMGCPYATGELHRREAAVKTADFLAKFTLNDTQEYLTSDSGSPIEDQDSLKAGARGPTLMEDFIFRQKITHFDHERVPERAVHARGAGKRLAVFRFELSKLIGIIQAHMARLCRTVTSAISLAQASLVRKGRRLPCLCVSVLSLEAAVAQVRILFQGLDLVF